MKLVRRGFFLSLPLMAGFARRARAFALVTADQAAREAGADKSRGGFPRESPPDAPVIELVAPASGQTLRSPFGIQLTFAAAAGSVVMPETFAAKYGVLGIDITDTLRKYARIDRGGLLAKDAEIPAGSHRITLSVADDKGRRGSRLFQFTVV